MGTVDTSIIISTYNAPDRLEKTLWGYESQTERDFEIIIADDGSTDATKQLVDQYRDQGLPLRHVWHEDRGFQKNRILNKALRVARGRYCIFTDGDCVPRSDFVEMHCRLRKPNQFLGMGCGVNVPAQIHEKFSHQDVTSGDIFSLEWLSSRATLPRRDRVRLSANQFTQTVFNFLTHRPTVFTGNGSSVWRQSAMAVNGFDERMRYGGEDKDFGIRLSAFGLGSRLCKFSLVCVHLNHPRPYVDQNELRANRKHLWKQRWRRTYWTDFGLEQGGLEQGELEQDGLEQDGLEQDSIEQGDNRPLASSTDSFQDGRDLREAG